MNDDKDKSYWIINPLNGKEKCLKEIDIQKIEQLLGTDVRFQRFSSYEDLNCYLVSCKSQCQILESALTTVLEVYEKRYILANSIRRISKEHVDRLITGLIISIGKISVSAPSILVNILELKFKKEI